jgi:hypothetical protein
MIKNSKYKVPLYDKTGYYKGQKYIIDILLFIIFIILNTYNRASFFSPFIYSSPTISINMMLTSKAIASFNMVTIKRII